ncbi:MAG: competence/damage-inducible protein A [Alistipes sp.]|nr:competence/damage-inducible protein A [Alistipes sp.]
MKATIITIGDEILIGQIVDTNSVSIAKHLNTAGITVHEKISIGDTAQQIEQTLARALAQSEVVIITGGLGPTKDDITKHTLAKIFESGMHEDKCIADHVRTMLERRGIEYNALNQGQAMVPDCCTVLFNAHGTAPGMWFEDTKGRVTISLPGVPFEMEHLMEDEVMPRLKAHFALHANIHRTMITSGLPESMLAARIEEWEDALPPNIKLAYLPAPNIVRLRLSAYDAEDGEAMRAQIDAEFDKLYKIIPDHIVGFEGATVQELIHNILIEKGLTLATAESCTGGAIASRFTAMAGASAYFLGGVVAYANEAKRDILGVNYDDITSYGAVSEQVARQMAEGARRITGADYAIATTGIAGPTGGTAEKPVGTVWMAVATPTQTIAVLRNCGTDRGQIINRASAYVIEMLYKELKKT